MRQFYLFKYSICSYSTDAFNSSNISSHPFKYSICSYSTCPPNLHLQFLHRLNTASVLIQLPAGLLILGIFAFKYSICSYSTAMQAAMGNPTVRLNTASVLIQQAWNRPSADIFEFKYSICSYSTSIPIKGEVGRVFKYSICSYSTTKHGGCRTRVWRLNTASVLIQQPDWTAKYRQCKV